MLRSDKYNGMLMLRVAMSAFITSLDYPFGEAMRLCCRQSKKSVESDPLKCSIKLRNQIEWAEHMISSV